MENKIKNNTALLPLIPRLSLYVEYQLLMISGVFFGYQLVYTLLYEFNWKFIVIWLWCAMQQVFYYQRHYDRLEIHKKIKWYHALPYWGFTALMVYFIIKRIDFLEFLDKL